MRLIFLTFLSAAVISVPATAQTTQQRCAELKAERAALYVEAQNASAALDKVRDARTTALRRIQAIEGAARDPVLVVLLEAEAYSARGMRRFREENRLPADLDDLIRAERPAEFWRRADTEVFSRVDDFKASFDRIFLRQARNDAEYDKLLCQSAPPEASGPLPIERRPDGQPTITDALITRWVKARYALANSGGASHWQAGQMTQLDYREVDERFQSYFSLMRVGGMAEQFSDDEMRAITARWVDIRNVREGIWSQIKF